MTRAIADLFLPITITKGTITPIIKTMEPKNQLDILISNVSSLDISFGNNTTQI